MWKGITILAIKLVLLRWGMTDDESNDSGCVVMRMKVSGFKEYRGKLGGDV